MMRQMLPLAARIGEAEVDIFDVVLPDHLHDFFGVGHSVHSPAWGTLTRLATLGTLSRIAGEGLVRRSFQPLSCIAGEGGPSPQGWVGEGRWVNELHVVVQEEF